MAESIGIKLADGSFYPILDDNVRQEDLELTTVRENQTSVQIDLFRKKDEDKPEYIGSLIVEDIAEKLAGEPTISLNLKVDEDQNLSAEASDMESGVKQALKVSLQSPGELSSQPDGATDFDLVPMDDGSDIGSDPKRDDVSVSPDKDEFSDVGFTEVETEKRGSSKLLFGILILIGIVALAIAVLLFSRSCSKKESVMIFDDKSDAQKNIEPQHEGTTTSVPPTPSENAQQEYADGTNSENDENINDVEKKRLQYEEKVRLAKEQAEQEAEVARLAEEKRKEAERLMAEKEARRAEEARLAAEKASSNFKTTSSGAVRYKLKWGDTLWDLSETFYKNPWNFKIIAEYNSIKNPSHIIAGTYIDIPPK